MMNDWSWIEPAIAIFGLAVITVVSRSFFMSPERELPLPDWLKRGLKYAPLAALAALDPGRPGRSGPAVVVFCTSPLGRDAGLGQHRTL